MAWSRPDTDKPNSKDMTKEATEHLSLSSRRGGKMLMIAQHKNPARRMMQVGKTEENYYCP